MLPRQSIQQIVELLAKTKEERIQQNIVAHSEQVHRQEQAVSWGGHETSMIEARRLPEVKAMIERLEKKYSEQFEKMGGTWDILGGGSRFTMASKIPPKESKDPNEQEREPYTYLLVKNKDQQWKLYYIDGKKDYQPVEIDSILGLKTVLAQLPTNMSPEDFFKGYLPDRQDRRKFRYERSSQTEQKAYVELEKVFHEHHHSRPQWTVVSRLEDKLEKDLAEAKPDHDKIWQDQVKLTIFQSCTNALGQSYFYSNTNPPVTVHNYSLAKLLALQAIAALDPDQTFRPHEEARLNLLPTKEEREQAKRKRIEESFENDFSYKLYDIAREHSDDNPRYKNDRNTHIPSCPGGAFGRTVFASPLNAVSALGEGSWKAIEAQAREKAAAIGEDINYYDILPQIESFIFEELNKANNKTKKAVYYFYTAYMSGVKEPEEKYDEDREEYEQLKKNGEIFKNFIDSLNYGKLKDYLATKLSRLPLNDDNANLAVVQVFSLVTEGLQPRNLMKKNFDEIYAIQEDRNFIERLKNLGARVSIEESVDELVSRNEEVLSYRKKICDISYLSRGLETIIYNEVYRGLLAAYALNQINVSHGSREEKEKFAAISEKIKDKFKFIKEKIEKELKPEIESLKMLAPDLASRMEEKATTLPGAEQLEQSRASGLFEKIRNSCAEKQKEMEKVEHLITLFSALSQGNAAELRNIFGWKEKDCSPAAWAKGIADVAFSTKMTLQDRKRELERFNELMKSCYSEREIKKITLSIGSYFLEKLSDPKNQKLDWQFRKEAIHLLMQAFPAVDLKYQAIIDYADLTKETALILTDKTPVQADELFETAGLSLVMAELEKKLDGNGKSIFKAKATDSRVYDEHYQKWMSIGKKLLHIEEKPAPNLPGIDPKKIKDSGFEQIVHFAVLTVCRNLGLTDIRLKDKQAIEDLCDSFLTTRKPPIIDLRDNSVKDTDTLERRLSRLTTHLSHLVTTLKPLSTLYNTGHVRIMSFTNAESVEVLGNNISDIKNGKILFRISMSSPTTIAKAEKFKTPRVINGHHYDAGSVMQTKIGVDDDSLITSCIKINKVDFYLLHQDSLEKYLSNLLPELALVPFTQERRIEEVEEQTSEHHENTTTYFQRAYSIQRTNSIKLSLARQTSSLQHEMYAALPFPPRQIAIQKNVVPQPAVVTEKKPSPVLSSPQPVPQTVQPQKTVSSDKPTTSTSTASASKAPAEQPKQPPLPIQQQLISPVTKTSTPPQTTPKKIRGQYQGFSYKDIYKTQKQARLKQAFKAGLIFLIKIISFGFLSQWANKRWKAKEFIVVKVEMNTSLYKNLKTFRKNLKQKPPKLEGSERQPSKLVEEDPIRKKTILYMDCYQAERLLFFKKRMKNCPTSTAALSEAQKEFLKNSKQESIQLINPRKL